MEKYRIKRLEEEKHCLQLAWRKRGCSAAESAVGI
jgi:hypothetical protein